MITTVFTCYCTMALSYTTSIATSSSTSTGTTTGGSGEDPSWHQLPVVAYANPPAFTGLQGGRYFPVVSTPRPSVPAPSHSTPAANEFAWPSCIAPTVLMKCINGHSDPLKLCARFNVKEVISNPNVISKIRPIRDRGCRFASRKCVDVFAWAKSSKYKASVIPHHIVHKGKNYTITNYRIATPGGSNLSCDDMSCPCQCCSWHT